MPTVEPPSETADPAELQKLARYVGLSLLATIVIGIIGALSVAAGIDINLNADVTATAQNMLEAETDLRAKAYLGALTFALDLVVAIGLFLLLRRFGALLAGWALAMSVVGALLGLLGAVFAMNAAEIAGDRTYLALPDQMRTVLAGLQATSDYTSFHLGLVISSAAKAGFFALFLSSRLIPALVAGWGVFASLFVAVTIVARDFIPFFGQEAITVAFMASNLIALVATGLYLAVRGVRTAAI